MLPIINSRPVLYLLLTKLIWMCSSFVILSSAEGGDNSLNIFKAGTSFHYAYRTKILLDEKNNSTKSVAFRLNAAVIVNAVWSDDQFQRLLKVEVLKPQLLIRSSKSNPENFSTHSSPLDQFKNTQFLLLLRHKDSTKFYFDPKTPVSLVNIQKAIASLLQVQLGKTEPFQESDASGSCTVSYSFPTPLVAIKTKSACTSLDFPFWKHPNPVLDTNVDSTRTTVYELDSDESLIKSITAKEHHQMSLNANEALGSSLTSKQTLKHVKTVKIQHLTDDLNTVLEQISRELKTEFKESSLELENELSEEPKENFVEQLDKVRELLSVKSLGTVQQARTFLQLVESARRASKQDVSKVLSSNQNKNIIFQLYDVLGYAQTPDIHQIVVKKLHFDNEQNVDALERYLWALSFNSQPEPSIIEDLLKKFTSYENVPAKLKETLILTIASMTQKLAANKLAKQVEETILNELDYATNEDRFPFYRALMNLQSKTTVPHLLELLKNSNSSRENVLIWKTLRSYRSSWWTEGVLSAARKTFLQLDRKYDTSARTLALDVILEVRLHEDNTLEELLHYLTTNDREFEVKQYLVQRFNMLVDESEQFANRLKALITKDTRINNYSTLSPRGASTALKRTFFKGNSTSGNLISIQEINKGIVKRGTVGIMLGKDGEISELLNLGIYSGGLSSFVSSDNDEENQETSLDEETATAGMELTVLGTQIRPFVFFSGQGELMGHVWSGTASERTPAYQALILLQDHDETIRLGSGFLLKVSVKGAISFDLAGQVEISLWNRNCKSIVEKAAGILTIGSMTVDSSFVRAQLAFSASSEPRLTLKSDVDFGSSRTMICMQLSQPDTLTRYNVQKIERIPHGKHKIRSVRYHKTVNPGRTYYLNRKNNEFCKAMLN